MAERNGTVLNFGTATDRGSLMGVPTTSYVVSIAAVLMPPPTTLAYDSPRPTAGSWRSVKPPTTDLLSASTWSRPSSSLVSTPDRKVTG